MKVRIDCPVVLPAGIHPAKFIGFEPGEALHGRIVKLYFEVLSGPYAGKGVSGICSIPNEDAPNSKLQTWCAALAGRDMAAYPPYEVDLNSLIGRPCRLNITVVERADGSLFNQLQAVLRQPMQRTDPDETFTRIRGQQS